MIATYLPAKVHGPLHVSAFDEYITHSNQYYFHVHRTAKYNQQTEQSQNHAQSHYYRTKAGHLTSHQTSTKTVIVWNQNKANPAHYNHGRHIRFGSPKINLIDDPLNANFYFQTIKLFGSLLIVLETRVAITFSEIIHLIMY